MASPRPPQRPPTSRLGVLGLALLLGPPLALALALAAPAEQPPAKPVKAHETSLAAGQEFHAGSKAPFRCTVQAVYSFTETKPHVGAAVDVSLRGANGKTYALAQGKTGGDGVFKADLAIPSLPGGTYKLIVVTRSEGGEEKLERDVTLKTDAKVLLVSDKPLYQPGQTIHLRALCLRPFDLSPVAGDDLTFEVEDPKGNKVFKRSFKTSDFGVAAVDFQLADEVNMGAYQVRATVGKEVATKTVDVRRYVLPKFKVEVKADKSYYLPKETVKIDVQADYFFGKPVANAKLKLTASTFDVQFRDFQTANVTTDARGHATLDVKLPDYFVGQPLQKGDALLKLEAKLTDSADHSETVARTFPVSDKAIRVSLISEGGRLVPGLENRVFAAALYPDGSPVATCAITLFKGAKAEGRGFAVARTNAAGLAEFKLTPKAEEFRQAEWITRNVETLGGTVAQAGPRSLLDITAVARDDKGNGGQSTAALNADSLGDNVVLRLDKAVYRVGDSMNLDVLTSAGLPTAYLDVVKGGQTVLTQWLDVKDGKATHRLDLPRDLFGTLEVHAYQMAAGGEILRDTRVVYVEARDGLKVTATADRDVYLPGAPGKIAFQVTDAAGKPTAAALGVLVVDEAVYALQEMQPGLEKVYFTLQEELLKPQAQAVYKPNTTVDALVRQGDLPAEKQQVAAALLTAVRPAAPKRWTVDPAQARKEQMAGRLNQVTSALFYHSHQGNAVVVRDARAKRWGFKAGLAEELQKNGWFGPDVFTGAFGEKLTLDDLVKYDKEFTPDGLASAVTWSRILQLQGAIVQYTNQSPQKWKRGDDWTLPATVLAETVRMWWGGGEANLKDAWGQPLRLVKRTKKLDNVGGSPQFDYHEIVSAGPDGAFDTADDVTTAKKGKWSATAGQWFNLTRTRTAGGMMWGGADRFGMAGGMPMGGMGGFGGGGPPPAPAGPGGGGGGGAFFGQPKAARPPVTEGMPFDAAAMPTSSVAKNGTGGGAAPPRLREFFPETMLWQPALIADDQGRAELPLTFADSITTWRLSASASSKAGALGGLSLPLRVFQDFFVDLDLPVALTQNDEVAFPVAVYNYLKTPQTLKLELKEEPWFQLLDGGLVRNLSLKPNEVTAVSYRIKAKKIGMMPLTVTATGSKMSDAVKRSVEVVPNGTKVEQVVSDTLGGSVKQTVTIPEVAIPDASKLIVKLYPGVFSQVLEGVDGLLRMPGG